jgi:hypothetical protein
LRRPLEPGQRVPVYYNVTFNISGGSFSLSRPRQVWDNAVVEAFYSTLKVELVRYVWATRAQARQAIFDFIEVFYNHQRLHSTLAYRTPAEYEACLPGTTARAA